MKKILMLITVLLILPLTGCTQLSDEYFENNSLHHVDEAMDQFEAYASHLKEYYKDNYPNQREMFFIQASESYIPHVDSLDTIERHELVNYHLTDHRGYMLEANIERATFILDYIYSFGVTECSNVKEGKVCETSEQPGITLMALQEESNVYIEYTMLVKEDLQEYQAVYTYYFRYEEELVTLDFTYKERQIDTLVEFEETSLYYKEDTLERSRYRTLLDNGNGYFEEIETTYDLKTKNYTKKVETNENARINHYNYENQELFGVTLENNEYKDFTYTTFNGTKNIISIGKDMTFYHVNFSEVAGWDYLESTEGDQKYKVYYNDTLIEDLTFTLLLDAGEYVFQYFETETTFDDELLSLSKFGMSLPYNNQFFQDKETYFMNNIDKILEDAFIEPVGVDAVPTKE